MHKVGDKVHINIETFRDGKKKISQTFPLPGSIIDIVEVPIVAYDKVMDTYKIILDSNIYGWEISRYHIEHQKVPEMYLGKKFYDIKESLILEEESDI